MKKVTMLLLFTAIIYSGCAVSNSTVKMDPADPNSPIEFTGKAADMVAEKVSAVLAQNAQTKEGRISALLAENKKYFGWLLLAMVGGLIFWGFTRSRYGWVIPAACIAGMAVILTFTKIADWVPYVIVAIGFGLFIWKAIEYQRERNTETLKRKIGDKT